MEQVRTQLFMMLVQQAGAGALPLSNLTAQEFLPFFRSIERSVTFHALSPVLVYWSSLDARWLMPEPSQIRDALCSSIFSEENLEKREEFCFLVHSRGISVVVYGHCSDDTGTEKIYQCVGSMDPHIVRRAYDAMIGLWQFIDLPEANRLDDARAQSGNPVTAPHFVSGIKHDWPVIKQRAARAVESPDPASEPADNEMEGHTLNEPETVVRPGAQTPFPQSAVALDKQTIIAASSSAAPPQPPIPPQKNHSASVKSSLKEVFKTASDPAAKQIHGDPSLLEDEFNFQELTSSAHFKPPESRNSSSNKGNGSQLSEKKKEQNRGMRELREAWTNITQEVRTDFAAPAQRVIKDIVSRLRQSGDLPAILDFSIEELTKLSKADRGVIWQIVDDQLVVTNEFAANNHECFKGSANLGNDETAAILSEFLSRFPDESGNGSIAIHDTSIDTRLRRMSPTLAALIELGDVTARLVTQIRSRGVIHGFIELQQCGSQRYWSDEDNDVLQSVSEILSPVVQQSLDLTDIKQKANEMELVNDISAIFRESDGQQTQYSIEEAIKLFSEYTGFTRAQLFLYDDRQNLLVPQISSTELSSPIPIVYKSNNPFLQVFESSKQKAVNLEPSKKPDAIFGHETALIVPLVSEGEKLGVLGLWKRKQGLPMLRPHDRQLALTVASNLASIIRVENTNSLRKQQLERESLINVVSEQIQQSLKEVNPILETLVEELSSHQHLGLCALSIWDSDGEKFLPPISSGEYISDDDTVISHLVASLFSSYYSELSKPEFISQSQPAIFLNNSDVQEAVGDSFGCLPGSMQLTTLLPLRQESRLKGALCMISDENRRPSIEDMRMIQDLLHRCAVAVEHKELFEKVEKQAITDPLTSLYNRRYFEEQLNKEIDRHQRFGHALSYIILDLDHFKSVNDTLDHQNGDIALKHAASIVKKCVRDVDTVARFGGEEFVVLLPESDSAAAKVVADRICAGIRESVIDKFRSSECLAKIQEKLQAGKINEATAARLSDGRVTASVGVATFPVDADEKIKLMELADKYLYLAKGRGRNQVCTSKDDNGEPLPSEKKTAERSKAPLAAGQAKPAPTAAADPCSQLIENPELDLKVVAEQGILGMLGSVIKKVLSKDGYGDDRSSRASDYASRIALALRLSREHSTVISLAAVLNNLGKVIVDKEVLLKSGPLSPDEWTLLESAPSTAARILEPAKHLHRVATVVETYQEHWDGTGYPRGLKGEDIPLEARIIAVVDAFVAMTSNRPYRQALSREEATAILTQGAGKEWDPRIVKLFLSILAKEANY